MKRRDWTGWALAATAAAAAGAAWRWRVEAAAPAAAAASTTATAPAGSSAVSHPPSDDAAFWQSRFTQPDGQPLPVETLRGRPLVLNFWATWCPPCLKEMPELDRFARGDFAQRGGRVVGLAIDSPGAVAAWLARTPVAYAIALAGFEGTDLARRLGNTTGALPYTAVFDRQGRVVQRKLGIIDFAELERWTAGL